MRQAHYIELTTPRLVHVSPDPESPTVPAPILKILHEAGPDELAATASITVTLGYGFINSRGDFVLLDRDLITETIADIRNEAEGSGQNPATNRREPAGNWYSRITQPQAGQGNRAQGDYRRHDLYQHLIDKLGIDGTIREHRS
jgi:hypothetical protein